VFQALRKRRRERFEKASFPATWLSILGKRVPYYRLLSQDEQRELRNLIRVFLAETKERHFVPNVERRTSNAERPTPNVELRQGHASSALEFRLPVGTAMEPPLLRRFFSLILDA
jgi:hypothetical protein